MNITISQYNDNLHLIYYKSARIGDITLVNGEVVDVFSVRDNFGTVLHVSRNLEDAKSYAIYIFDFQNYKKEMLERISAFKNALRYEDSPKTIDLTFEDRE